MTPAAIALGANLGNPARAFADALAGLCAGATIRIDRVSSLYRSAPWGFEGQADFTNAVALVATTLSGRSLLERLKEEEVRAGRTPARRWGPRVLDLDLLWYGTSIVDEPDLSIPHPRLAQRSFVLGPLAEIAPHWRHPVTGSGARELLARLEETSRATVCHRIEGAFLGARAVEPCPS